MANNLNIIADPIPGTLQSTPLVPPELEVTKNSGGSITIDTRLGFESPITGQIQKFGWGQQHAGSCVIQISLNQSFPSSGTKEYTRTSSDPFEVELEDYGTYYVRAKFLPETSMQELYSESDWSTVSVVIENPISAQVKETTQNTATLSTSYQSGIAEIRLSKSPQSLSSGTQKILPIVSGEVLLRDLDTDSTYFADLRYSTDSTNWSGRSAVICFTTKDYGVTSKADRLRWIRKRIDVLRRALSDESTLSNVSVDGVSETWISRDSMARELKQLEAEEARLENGCGRMIGIDLSRM